jgi:glutathione S-transferase
VVLLALVTVFALIGYMALGLLVGWARIKYEVPAPATTGNPLFERYFRAYQNTLETLVIFVPGLWLFGRFVNIAAATTLGILFLLARITYVVGYLWKPERRVVGAAATAIVNAMLLFGSLLGLCVYFVYH